MVGTFSAVSRETYLMDRSSRTEKEGSECILGRQKPSARQMFQVYHNAQQKVNKRKKES